MPDIAATRPHYAPLIDLDADAVRCPYPFFARLREETPVEWIEELGCYAVSRYDDILEVIHDPERFSSRMPTGPRAMQDTLSTLQDLLAERSDLLEAVGSAMGVQATAVLLNADPPVHDRQRALVNRAFTPRRVKAMEGRIQEIADSLIDAFIDRGECEFIAEYAVGLPLTVIAEALGVPTGDMPMFKRWSDDFVVAIGNHRLSKDRLERLLVSQGEFFAYFTERIDERREQPCDDLITDVVHATIDGERPLETVEMLGMLSQFLVAGNETTTKLLGSALLLLLRNPEVLAAVQRDPALVPGLVEEALRLEPPVQGLFRMANVATTVGGVEIPAGASLWVLYASGNRDESEFADPDAIDLARENAKAHLAFGHGVHYCLGAALSRAEARIGIETLIRRIDGLSLAPEANLDYEESYALHGLKALPITFRRR